jgi:PhnB protein
MSRVSTYLNFEGQAEEAFNFYASVFATRITSMLRMGDVSEGMPPIADAEKRLILNVQLPILSGHVLMGTDMIASLGHHLVVGNNTTIALEPDSKEEADRLYSELSADGNQGSGMSQMFFGYWGSCLDRFGVRWMINYTG